MQSNSSVTAETLLVLLKEFGAVNDIYIEDLYQNKACFFSNICFKFEDTFFVLVLRFPNRGGIRRLRAA